jgi:hypothetical protein
MGTGEDSMDDDPRVLATRVRRAEDLEGTRACRRDLVREPL